MDVVRQAEGRALLGLGAGKTAETKTARDSAPGPPFSSGRPPDHPCTPRGQEQAAVPFRRRGSHGWGTRGPAHAPWTAARELHDIGPEPRGRVPQAKVSARPLVAPLGFLSRTGGSVSRRHQEGTDSRAVTWICYHPCAGTSDRSQRLPAEVYTSAVSSLSPPNFRTFFSPEKETPPALSPALGHPDLLSVSGAAGPGHLVWTGVSLRTGQAGLSTCPWAARMSLETYLFRSLPTLKLGYLIFCR